MPAIPIPRSEVSLEGAERSLDRSLSSVQATPDMFGASAGRTLQTTGQEIEETARRFDAVMREEREKKRGEKVANGVAQSAPLMTAAALRAQREAPPNGQGVVKSTADAQRELIDKKAAELYPDDPKAASDYRTKMFNSMGHYGTQAAQFEFGQEGLNSRHETGKALDVLQNQARTDAQSYEMVVSQGIDVINNSSSISQSEKKIMGDKWQTQAANARFEGLLVSAKTVQDVEAIEKELTQGPGAKGWQSVITPADFEKLQTHIKSTKVTFSNKADIETRLVIEGVEARALQTFVPDEEVNDMVQRATQSRNVSLQEKAMRVVRDQRIYRETKGLPIDEIAKLEMASRGGQAGAAQGVPPEVSSAISVATRAFSGISGGVMGALVKREYGMYLKQEYNEDGTPIPIYYGHGNAGRTSNAMGIGQFIPRTWKEMRDPTKFPGLAQTVQSVLGVDIEKLSEAQWQDMRKDMPMSIMMTVAYADANRRALEAQYQRPLTDAEIYMTHFLGRGGANMLITANASRPGDIAAQVLPEAADANKTVFYSGGRALTVGEVYNNISRSIMQSPGKVQWGDAEAYRKRREAVETGVRQNGIGFAQREGSVTIVPLTSPGGWEARGNAYQYIAQNYKVPREETKPFDTDTEVPQLQKIIKDGKIEDVIALFAQMSLMDRSGPGAFAAGMKQLGEKDTAFAVAAGLAGGPNPDLATAQSIIKGQRILDQDKSDAKTVLGAGGASGAQEVDNAFNSAVGSALRGLPPGQADALRKAAKAHYIATAPANGATTFDSTLFAKSVQAVMGGQGEDRIVKINGAAVVLPHNVKAPEFTAAVQKLTNADLVRYSVDDNGKPLSLAPVYGNGRPVSAYDVSTQGKLEYAGADVYQVRMSDGKFLVVPQGKPGGLMYYAIKLNRAAVQELIVRPTAPGSAGEGNDPWASPDAPTDAYGAPTSTPGAAAAEPPAGNSVAGAAQTQRDNDKRQKYPSLMRRRDQGGGGGNVPPVQ